MDYAALLSEIQTDPLGLGYAAMLPDSPGQVVEAINAKNYSAPKSLMISERGIMDKYVGGAVAADALLSKLEAFSITAHAAAPVLKRALKFLAQPDGLDIGSPSTQGMLTIFASAGVITEAEATGLKSLANQPASRAAMLGLAPVTEEDLRNAGAV